MLAAQDSTVVATIGNQSERSPFNYRQWIILDSRFIIFMSTSVLMSFIIIISSSGSMKFVNRLRTTVLIASVKIPDCRGASHHPAFIGNCLTISHTYYPYLFT